MKATLMKSVSLTTALGVLLVGCGGGPAEDTRTTSLGSVISQTTPTSTPIPTMPPITSGGSGSVGYSSEMAGALNAIKDMGTKIDKIDKNAQTAADKSKKNNTLLIALAGLAGAGLIFLGAKAFIQKKRNDQAREKAGLEKVSWLKGMGQALTGKKEADVVGVETKIQASAAAAKASEAATAAQSADQRAAGLQTQLKEFNEDQAADMAAIQGNVFTTGEEIKGKIKDTATTQRGEFLELKTALEDFRAASDGQTEKLQAIVTKLESGLTLSIDERRAIMDAISNKIVPQLETKMSEENSKLQSSIREIRNALAEIKTKPVTDEQFRVILNTLNAVLSQMPAASSPTTVVATAAPKGTSPTSLLPEGTTAASQAAGTAPKVGTVPPAMADFFNPHAPSTPASGSCSFEYGCAAN